MESSVGCVAHPNWGFVNTVGMKSHLWWPLLSMYANDRSSICNSIAIGVNQDKSVHLMSKFWIHEWNTIAEKTDPRPAMTYIATCCSAYTTMATSTSNTRNIANMITEPRHSTNPFNSKGLLWNLILWGILNLDLFKDTSVLIGSRLN